MNMLHSYKQVYLLNDTDIFMIRYLMFILDQHIDLPCKESLRLNCEEIQVLTEDDYLRF